jgi:two-component system LytT family sensor kinase
MLEVSISRRGVTLAVRANKIPGKHLSLQVLMLGQHRLFENVATERANGRWTVIGCAVPEGTSSEARFRMQMKSRSLLQQRWFRVPLIVAAWTLFGAFLASQMYLAYGRSEMPIQYKRIFLVELIYAYQWAALTPFILWLSRRAPIERSKWIRSLSMHIGASILMGFTTRILHDLMFFFLLADSSRGFSFTRLLMNVYFMTDYGVMIYWLILLVSHAIDYQKRYREGQVRATKLEAQLAQAQLQALKMQLQPHFLFNTLHSISALVHKNADAADRMIARLGDFLRLTLENGGTQEVSLAQELEFLKCYLEIERIRFQDRLTVQMDIEPQTLDAQLPNLILQPIVENAIRHGIAPRTSAGRIEIEARRLNGTLRVQVTDNGPGLASDLGSGTIVKEGVGLSNTEARLKQLYGDAHRLDLSNTPKGGLTVLLEIPFRENSSSQN